MDTRTKILTSEQGLDVASRHRREGSVLVLVTGYFDPLVAGHARALEEVARPGGELLVLLATPSSPVLPPRARAELVASLGVVDYVVLPGNELFEDLLRRFQATEVVRQEGADEQRRLDLIRHVHKRIETS